MFSQEGWVLLLFVLQGQFKGSPRCKNPAVDPGYAACVVSDFQTFSF